MDVTGRVGRYVSVPERRRRLAILVNEVDSDQAGNDAAEFVELYNTSPSASSLDGYVLVFYNGSNDRAYAAFDLDGYTIAANGYFVVGNPGVQNVTVTFSPGSGGLLQNGQDAVALYRGNASDFDTSASNGTFVTTANLVDALVYDTDDDDDPGLLALLNAGQPQVNEGEGTTDPTTVSMQRMPDGAGGERNTSGYGLAAPTPGAANAGAPTPVPPAQALTISEIQGDGLRSDHVGERVQTSGIVTAVASNGFYLQSAVGDGNEATSDAVFVFTGSGAGARIGDAAAVVGTVSEFVPGGAATGNLSTTQVTLESGGLTVTASGQALPAATILGDGGRLPPTESLTAGTAFYESLEGMRVTIDRLVTTAPTSDFGEIYGVIGTANGVNATGLSERGTLNVDGTESGLGITNASGPGADFNPERIQIEDDFLPAPEVDVGATIAGVTGVVSYNFGNYEILATERRAVTPSTLQKETGTLTRTDSQLLIASYNVENLDPGDGAARFTRIANDIVTRLNAPDIVSLEEVQDNNGPVNDATTSASATLQGVVDALNARVGADVYAFADNPFITDDANGGEPGGNIRVAFIYRTDRVSLTGLDEVTVLDAQGQPIPQTDPANPFNGARPPLVGNFEFEGEAVTVIGNHFTSKGGSTPLFGEQPPVNGGEIQRIGQADAVNDYVDGLLAQDSAANVVVLGDLNDFEFEEPLQVLDGRLDLASATGTEDGWRDAAVTLAPGNAVLNNLTFTLPEDERYSYVFEGNSQAIDHALVSDNLLASTEYDVVHINSEFADQASDHDPLLVRLDLEGRSLKGGSRADVLEGAAGADVLQGGSGNDTLDGRGGDDRIAGDFGRDTLVGGLGDDDLRGGSGNDTLDGGRGNDRLEGSFGNDTLEGGAGDDQLSGGLGRDVFVFRDAEGGLDTITDFARGDRIALDAEGFGFSDFDFVAGTASRAAQATVLFDADDQTLSIDLDGTGAMQAFAIAQFEGRQVNLSEAGILLV